MGSTTTHEQPNYLSIMNTQHEPLRVFDFSSIIFRIRKLDNVELFTPSMMQSCATEL